MVKKCMDYEVESVRPRGRPKKLGLRLRKKIGISDRYSRKMLWTAGNGKR